MNSQTQITAVPQTYILTLPQEQWYQQKAFTTLFGVFAGFILGFGANVTKEYLQRRTMVKSMAFNLFTEIGINYTKSSKSAVELTDIYNRFKKVSTTFPQGSLSDTPRIEHHGIENNAYYTLYFKDLYLLEQPLQERIAHLYSILRSITAISKPLSERFRDYYKGDTIVKPDDILDQLSKMIMQYKAIEEVAAEALAIVSITHKKSEFSGKESDSDKKLRDAMDKYLDNIKPKTEFTLREASEATGISLLTCAYFIRKYNKAENSSYGKYTLINS
jgi:hypothetical protein